MASTSVQVLQAVDEPQPLPQVAPLPRSLSYELAKRAIDIIGALVGLTILLLVLPFVALAIKLDSPGPVFYRTTRLTRGGRPFGVLKFRSMYADAEAQLESVRHLNIMEGPTFKAPSDPRVTRVGKRLRQLSLDELPQCWNVLRGEMSLVGPRPSHFRDFEGEEEILARRCLVKPGLTGLWQVSGRNLLPHGEMVRLDLEYVERRSLLLDLQTVARTIPALLTRRGAM